jgi:hypothetical protein
MKASELYDADFAEWTRQNAELLRSGRVAEADLEHIAEEIEDMGKRERRSFHNRLVRLVEHLLQCQYQPERRGASWIRTIVVQRQAIRRVLDENPSFRPTLSEVAAEAYRDAAGIVSAVTRRPRTDFPPDCPFSLAELLDDAFLP